ncbi:MAG: hypothetical protein U5L95_03090 [Candidatus Saccharibacteria bacterium]|nr:hypothetical protein [Candidatus Saccharibacteria bacterium]
MSSSEAEKSEIEFTSTPQQAIGRMLIDAHNKEQLKFALDRSCTAHCVEAIAEMSGLKIPSFSNIEAYTRFLLESMTASHRQSTDLPTDAKLYFVDDGWSAIAVADLVRLSGYGAVSHNLNYPPKNTDVAAMEKIGRVRSDFERQYATEVAEYGGQDKAKWLLALQDTKSHGGFPVVSIEIPSSEFPDKLGRHSVVFLEADETHITYFDPDQKNISRYGEAASHQQIHKEATDKLIYRQPLEKFLDRMSGEVIHIFTPIALNSER